MTAPPDLIERLAGQLELPPAERRPGGDEELAALLAVAAHTAEEWSALAPAGGAAARVYRAAVEAAAEGAAPRRRRPRLRFPTLPGLPRISWPARAAAVTALAATILAIASLVGRGPSTKLILDRAEAAITLPGKIIHQVLDQETATTAFGRTTTTRYRVESWGRFDRDFRMHLFLRDRSGRVDSEVLVTGREFKTYRPATNTIEVAPPPSQPSGLDPADGLGSIKRAFGENRVKLAGKTEVGGKPGYVLRVEAPRTAGETRGTMTYIVDRETYLPLKLDTSFEIKVAGTRTSGSSRSTFLEFDPLEPTTANQGRLEMESHPGARIVRVPASAPGAAESPAK